MTSWQRRSKTDEGTQGYDVHAVDVNDGEKLKSLGCTTFQLDVASEDSINRFKEHYGDRPLDLLLNVAGMTARPCIYHHHIITHKVGEMGSRLSR